MTSLPSQPALVPTCYPKSSSEGAVPPVRIAALMKPYMYGKNLTTPICLTDYEMFFKDLGKLILERLVVK
jgi:hypothetical protein